MVERRCKDSVHNPGIAVEEALTLILAIVRHTSEFAKRIFWQQFKQSSFIKGLWAACFQKDDSVDENSLDSTLRNVPWNMSNNVGHPKNLFKHTSCRLCVLTLSFGCVFS